MNRRKTRATFFLPSLVVASIMLSACGAGVDPYGAMATGSGDTISVDTLSSPDPAGGSDNCGTASLFVDYAPADVKTLVGYGWGFVAATVSSSEPAFFNTVDGSAPVGFMAKGSNSSATIFTPFVVQVDSVLTSKGSVGQRRVVVEGGVVGCTRVTVDGAPRLSSDQSYVLVLAPASDANGKDLGLDQVVYAWPIDSSGGVVTVDGPATVSSLGDQVQHAELSAP
jgi:hypothetical protein